MKNLWSSLLLTVPVPISCITINGIDLIRVANQRGPTFSKPYSEFKSILIDYNGLKIDSTELGDINTSISGSRNIADIILGSSEYIFNGKILN